ncbi:MAG: sulfite exporter TauE/SafE family protein, partial [Acidimicrobiales bacterium]
GLAGTGAGAVNALAGGGTLISFPVLVGLGLPAVRANVTNLVALTPGYVAGTAAQRRDLEGQARQARALLPVAAAGGLVGSIVLVNTPAASFREAVPYLLVFSSVLLAAQGPVRTFFARRSARALVTPARAVGTPIVLSTFVSAVYGGYFGAGLGIMLLALMGLFSEESLVRLNALKQALSFVISLVAAIFLAVAAHVAWTYAAVLAPCAVVGGILGGRFVRVVPASVLRLLVVVVGVAVAIRYWV